MTSRPQQTTLRKLVMAQSLSQTNKQQQQQAVNTNNNNPIRSVSNEMQADNRSLSSSGEDVALPKPSSTANLDNNGEINAGKPKNVRTRDIGDDDDAIETPPAAKRQRIADTGFTDTESEIGFRGMSGRGAISDGEIGSDASAGSDLQYSALMKIGNASYGFINRSGSPQPQSRLGNKTFRKKSQRLKKSKTSGSPNGDASVYVSQWDSRQPDMFMTKVSEFMDRLGRYSRNVFHYENADQYSNSESGSESTDAILEEDDPGATAYTTSEEKAHQDAKNLLSRLMTQEERNGLIKRMQDDQDKVEDQLYTSHQHFLDQTDHIFLLESHLKETRFLDDIQEQQRQKQKELFSQRIEMRQEVRQEELLHWQQRRQKIKRREQLDLMKRKNFGMMQMRKIIEHKRTVFNVWMKNLELRQNNEREHLSQMQKRKKNSRAALFGVKLKALKPDERKHLQKEFRIVEQHHKMVDFKQLQYLEEYHKIHRTFAVRKFEQEIQLLEGEQLLFLEHEQKVGELLIAHADSILEALTDIEAIKCDIEDAYLRISHQQMFRTLRLQQRKAHKLIAEFHQQQLKNPSVFEVDTAAFDAWVPVDVVRGKEPGRVVDSVSRSLWSWSLSPCDNGSFVLVDSLFRLVSDDNVKESMTLNKTFVTDTGSDSSSLEGNAYNYDEHSFDRQLSRERKRLSQLQSEYQNSLTALDSLKVRHLAELRELRSQQQKELQKYYSEKMEIVVQLLAEKAEELKDLSRTHSRERISLVSLQTKELENFRALLTKEVDLQRTAQQMKAVMEAMLDPMIVSDEFGRMIVVNESASRLFEYDASDLRGQNISMLVDPKIAHHHDGYLKRYRETNDPHIIGTAGREVYGRKKSGELVPLHLSVSESIVEDKRIFIGCLHDLSETKKREIMLQKAKDEATVASQAKSYFLAQMSHEIRTPLHAMLGFSELLENASSLSSEQNDMVTSIRQCGNVLLSILSDILNYSKYETGDFELTETEFSIHEVIENAISNFFISACAKGLSLYYFISEEVPRCVFGDFTRFQQIVSHLISNGIKFTSRGGVTVTVSSVVTSCSSSSDSPVTLIIDVEDTGIGIPGDKFNLLFQRFSTLHDESVQTSGTGLGLALCKKVAQKMGGDVFLKSSTPNRGSTFSVRLPLKMGSSSVADAPFKRIMEEMNCDQGSLPVIGCIFRELSFDFFQSVCHSIGLKCQRLQNPHEAEQWLLSQEKRVILFCDLLVAIEWTNPDPKLPVILLLPPHHLTQKRKISGDALPSTLSMSLTTTDHVPLEQIPKSFLRLLLPIRRTGLFETILKASQGLKVLGGNDLNPVDPEERDIENMKVVIVEDNKINQKVLCKMLGSLKIQPTIVLENGLKSVQFFEQALKAGEQHPADLVFMDLQMPVMNGTDAMKRIRQAIDQINRGGNEKVKPPKIIALTASVSASQIGQIIEQGFDDCLLKPLTQKDLINCLHKVNHS